MNKKNIILFITTVSFVIAFCFILKKSYKVAEVNMNQDILPTIKNKNKIIKVKVKQEALDNNKEISSFYNEMEGLEEDISNIKVVKNIENNEVYTEKSKSIFKLNNIIMGNIDVFEDDVELDESIENIVINKQNNNTIEHLGVNDRENIIDHVNDVDDDFFKVQLIALKNKQQAELYVKNVKKMYKDLLVNLNIYILDVSLEEKGIFYRVRVGNFKDKKSAEKFCEEFFKKINNISKNCIVVR